MLAGISKAIRSYYTVLPYRCSQITACSNSTSILTSRAVPCSCFTIESKSGRETQSVVKKHQSISQHLPFLVTRSKFGNLPVYINYKKGRTRIITRIRNVRGDIELLHKLLLKHLDNPSLVTMVDELTGTITVHGHYREEIKIWLHQLGF